MQFVDMNQNKINDLLLIVVYLIPINHQCVINHNIIVLSSLMTEGRVVTIPSSQSLVVMQYPNNIPIIITHVSRDCIAYRYTSLEQRSALRKLALTGRGVHIVILFYIIGRVGFNSVACAGILYGMAKFVCFLRGCK